LKINKNWKLSEYEEFKDVTKIELNDNDKLYLTVGSATPEGKSQTICLYNLEN
jgi:hypothetical protein